MFLSSATDIEFLRAQNELRPTTPPAPWVHDYVHGHRIMPPESRLPGIVDVYRSPYLIEPMMNMSPASPVTHDACMKGAQIGYTWSAENVIAYYLDENPAPMLYISGTQELLEKWVTKRIEPLISSCGFRHKITAAVDNTKSRRTGDKTFSKYVTGGFLEMASAQSPAGLRQDSIKVLIIDEMDSAPRMLRTGEGIWVNVAIARTNAWNYLKKIMMMSTPTTFEESLIKVQYDLGDQRKYLIPCPFCKRPQELVMGNENTRHGLKPETKGGILQFAYYSCEFCHEAIFNNQKTEMLAAGRWEPTAVPSERGRVSRHISALYSPVGMFSWTEAYEEYLKAQNDLEGEGMRSFVNLVLGLPYKEKGARPKIENVINLRGGYREGAVPDGVLFLSFGCDVQAGSENDPTNPPRLELEVCGHGSSFKTWSITYKVIEGSIDDPFDGAWEKFYQWIIKTGLTFKRSDGMDFVAQIGLIDAGDGNYSNVVYQFTSRLSNVFPSKGFNVLKKKRNEKGDEISFKNFIRYRAAKTDKSGDITFIEIATNHYKTQLYGHLNVQRQPVDPQRGGFCDFPMDYGEDYFRMLIAEERRRDGSYHAGGRRNEALDCRVMNLCAADYWLAAMVSERRAAAKTMGHDALTIQSINAKTILQVLEKQTARRKP
jgi:phage terminase large subunit GpA-like protein